MERPLKDVIANMDSGARPKGGAQVSGVPSLGAEHLDGNGGFKFDNIKYVPAEFYSELRAGKICVNDILIVKDGATTGKTSFVTDDFPYESAAINEHVFRLTANATKIDASYLFRFLSSPHGNRQIMADFRGATVGGISRGIIDKVKVPLPPLPEQKRIAAILDKADALRQKRKQSLKLLDEFIRSVFLDMFGDPVVNPKGWPVSTIGEVLEFLTSGSRGWAKYYRSNGSIFLRIQNVGKNKLNLEDLTFVDAPDSTEARRTRVKSNDILLSITADLGRVAVIPKNFGEAYINQHLAILRPLDVVNPIYIAQYLCSTGGINQFKVLNKGGVKAGLNFNDIRSLKFNFAPITLQNKFAATTKFVNEIKANFKLSLREMDEQFNSLVQRAFRGEL